MLRSLEGIFVETTCASSTSLRLCGRVHDTGLRLFTAHWPYKMYDGCDVQESRSESSPDSQTTGPLPAFARATTSNDDRVPSLSCTDPSALVPSHLSCSGGAVGELVSPSVGVLVGSFDGISVGISVGTSVGVLLGTSVGVSDGGGLDPPAVVGDNVAACISGHVLAQCACRHGHILVLVFTHVSGRDISQCS